MQAEGRTIIGYGMGKAYWEAKEVMEGQFRLDYVMDRRWEEDTESSLFDGMPILRMEQVKDINNPLVVLFPRSKSVCEEIRHTFGKEGVEAKCFEELFALFHTVDSATLAKLPKHEWQDDRDNHIFFDSELGEGIRFSFWGRHNVVRLERMVVVDNLLIEMGSQGRCVIGEGTTIHNGWIWVSYNSCEIGKDCMISSQVKMMANDGHHIFDMHTGKRINSGKNIKIGSHVWVGYGATLLGGADIGSGSIVGEQAVTSSAFNENVVIAGNPARVIREDVVWSRDNTCYFDRQSFEDCMDQRAKMYMQGNGR